MQTINLKQYYPFCKEDICVEVSDEIVEAFLLDKRAEAARDRKMFRYKAFYSLDCNDGIENAAIGWAQPSPEDYLIEKEELAESPFIKNIIRKKRTIGTAKVFPISRNRKAKKNGNRHIANKETKTAKTV